MARKQTARERLAEIVAEAGTQRAVADRLDISPARVQQLVAGDRPGWKLAIKIQLVYQIPLVDWVR